MVGLLIWGLQFKLIVSQCAMDSTEDGNGTFTERKMPLVLNQSVTTELLPQRHTLIGSYGEGKK